MIRYQKVLYALFFVTINVFSQQIMIEYKFVRSPVATLNEKLYFKDNKTTSIQDSIVYFNDEEFGTHDQRNTKFSPQTLSFVTNNSTFRNFQFTETLSANNDIIFLVNDDNLEIKWNLKKEKSKNILGYKCRKATTYFRGRRFTAYYTREIQHSIGPYKFFGLPGAILEVYADNFPFYRWKATKVDLNNTDHINYKPLYKHLNQITLKDFVVLKDKDRLKFFNQVESDVPLEAGTTAELHPDRPSIETLYEWEK